MNKWIGRALLRPCLPLAVVLLLASGCASGPPLIHTEITAYNSWSSISGRTFSFRRAGPYANSLEIATYERAAADYLTAQGLTEVKPTEHPTLAVTLLPWVEPRNVEVQAPIDAGPFFGGWWRAPYPAFTNYAVTVYVRKLRLEIDDVSQTAPRRVYEGTVQNESNSDQMADAIPYLLKALFTNFPGNSGATISVNVAQ